MRGADCGVTKCLLRLGSFVPTRTARNLLQLGRSNDGRPNCRYKTHRIPDSKRITSSAHARRAFVAQGTTVAQLFAAAFVVTSWCQPLNARPRNPIPAAKAAASSSITVPGSGITKRPLSQ